MINEKEEKRIKSVEESLTKELERLLNKEDPGPNDYAFSRVLHEKLIFLQQEKERKRYAKILEKFSMK